MTDSPMEVPAYGVSGFKPGEAEHLAMIAIAEGGGSTLMAIEQIKGALSVLYRWQSDRIWEGQIHPGADHD